ncbi:MAG: toast rack family protein, partial [Gemmatimonadota bacterium]|nr:toast rack family protein [Gemmatimonadota bacterium]
MKRGVALALAVAVGLGSTAAGVAAQNWKTISASRGAQGERHLDVAVTYGVGVLRLSAAPDDLLYRTRLTFDADAATPVNEYHDGVLRLGLSGYRGKGLHFKDWSSEGSFDVELTQSVPMELSLEFGAVEADLDFTGLALRSLDLQTGASESSVHIDRLNPVQMDEATFQVGAADFHVRGVGNLNARRISVEAGVGSVTLELDGA